MHFFASILLFYFVKLSFEVCPNGSVPYFDDKISCIYFESNKAYFLNAEVACMNLGGHLASVKNMFENMFLSQQALVNFNDTTVTDFWIGANDLEFPSRWAWLDGTIFEFKDWDKGQPQNTSGTNCAAAIMKYGKWVADDCYTQKPYACMIQALTKTTHTKIASTTTSYVSKETTTLKSKTCGDWEYLDKTGFCYKFFGNSSTDHLTFWGAENKCQKFGGHLASIHSYGEAFLVGSMGPIRYANIWIGLFTDNIGKSWNWTDGTPFDYPNWITNEPENIHHNKCGAIFDKFETYTGGFCTYECDSPLFFACKRLPS